MFVMGESGFSTLGKPLYRLNQIIDNPHETAWLTEGEWCAIILITGNISYYLWWS